MQVQLEDPGQEIRRLQRCINDLVSLLALPAIWSGNDPSQIVPILLEALLHMLGLEFAYARVNDALAATHQEIIRVAESGRLRASPREIGEMVNDWLGGDGQKSFSPLRFRFGEEDISIFPVPLGVHGEMGLIVVGSAQADFPVQSESLLLSVAANQASVGLREARLLSEQKRIATELDQRVAERTAGLAAANEELKKEIADRRRAEEALQASERKLSLVVNTIPALAWSARPDGSADFFNQHYLAYVGLSLEELRGSGWMRAVHPDDLKVLAGAWQSIMASGKATETEGRLRRFDGVYRWFLFRTNPVLEDSGKILKWYGTNTDIDDRKRAEEQLRRSEAFLTEGQTLSRVGSFSWVVASGEIKWSEQLYRVFEFAPGVPVTLQLIGSRVHPDDLPLLYDMVEKAQRGVSDFEYEHRLLMPDHSVKYVHLIAHGSLDNQGRQEYIGAVQDVTQRRLAEEALAKARSELANVARVTSLGVLTASIAHEVNQPLSGIITNAGTCLRMLSADPPNIDGARETARRTIRDGNRAAEVVTRLRTLYSKKDLTFESMDLNEAAREVISLFLSELQRNQVILRPELAGDLPPVTGDRVQLQQVILNLLRNASDAMSTVDDRARELVIRTEREGSQVCLSVKDAGVGFTPQVAESLFEAFYTTKSDGMGIGLSVSRSIVEAHKGRLWATPNQGPGATFLFTIPCQERRTTDASRGGA
jgi:PAS domain S-box-containing protein